MSQRHLQGQQACPGVPPTRQARVSRTAYRTRFAVPDLAVELPSAIIHLDLLSIHGGTLALNTTAARIIDMLRDGLRDLEDGDLERIASLYHLVVTEVRKRENEGGLQP